MKFVIAVCFIALRTNLETSFFKCWQVLFEWQTKVHLDENWLFYYKIIFTSFQVWAALGWASHASIWRQLSCHIQQKTVLPGSGYPIRCASWFPIASLCYSWHSPWKVLELNFSSCSCVWPIIIKVSKQQLIVIQKNLPSQYWALLTMPCREVEWAWARARMPWPNFWLAVNKPQAQGFSKMLKVSSISNFSIFISKKLGLEAGSRVIWTGSGSFGLDTQSSSSARARINGARSISSFK